MLRTVRLVAAHRAVMPLALLEHLRLDVPSRQIAHEFYCTALGGKEASSDDHVLRINIGASQLHLRHQHDAPDGPQPVAASQWAGRLELWSREPLETIALRLQAVGQQPSISADGGGNKLLSVDCPWGNDFVIRTAPAGFDPSLHGAHPGGNGALIALTRAVRIVQPGAASRLHAFFAEVFGATCELAPHGDQPPTAHCLVRLSSGQQLIFDERASAPDEADDCKLTLCMDTLQAYQAAFAACERADAVAASAESGGALTWAEAEASGSFSLAALGRMLGADDDAGVASPAALVLETEIRSVQHPACPLTRADIVAGGGRVDTPAAFANWPPLKPPPHAKPGVIRIPHGRGGFGMAARELAAERRAASQQQQPGGASSGSATGTASRSAPGGNGKPRPSSAGAGASSGGKGPKPSSSAKASPSPAARKRGR